MNPSPTGVPTIIYCHCQYAQVVPAEVKAAVLDALCRSDVPFEAVPDLCELSARRDPSLRRLASAGPVKIAACFPRAVKWLFAGADAPLKPETAEVRNMRTESAEAVAAGLLSSALEPNVPGGRALAADASTLPSQPVS